MKLGSGRKGGAEIVEDISSCKSLPSFESMISYIPIPTVDGLTIDEGTLSRQMVRKTLANPGGHVTPHYAPKHLPTCAKGRKCQDSGPTFRDSRRKKSGVLTLGEAAALHFNPGIIESHIIAIFGEWNMQLTNCVT